MCRAARTLLYYLMETNLNYHHWLLAFIRTYPIPRVCQCCMHMEAALHRSVAVSNWPSSLLDDKPVLNSQDGAWDDVSGESFIRKLLTMPIQEAKWNVVRAHPGCMYEGMRHSCRINSRQR
jgi:hypothetical protein